MKSESLDNLLVSLGKAVTAKRKEQHFSQEDFAESCGLHRTYISEIENGKRNITIAAFCRLARGLGITPSELLQLAEKKEKETKKM
jgi:transcriptional regulator with XRE-family HTH domain